MAQRAKWCRQWLPRLAAVLYGAWMLWLLFGQRLGTQIYEQQLADRVNLIPFATISRYMQMIRTLTDPGLFRHALVNLVGNVVLFIPLGFFLPYFCRPLRGFLRTALTVLALIVVVELTQYVTLLGSCDVDDLVLNMAGALMGYPVWRLIVSRAGCQ